MYRQMADNLEHLIDSGTFRAGEKIPSVRQMSKDHRVSISTVMEAYALLEDRGCIEGRSRSGYYVKARLDAWDRIPELQEHENRPVDVSSVSIFEAMVNAVHRPEVVPFGAATPGDLACPNARLSSIGQALARKHGAAAYGYTVAPGRMDVRVQISKRCLTAGVDVAPSEIITTVGAVEALELALKATTRCGDVVMVETPTYFGLLAMIREQGLQAIEVPMHAETGVDIEAVAESLRTHDVKACLVQPNYHNPMGSVMPDANKKALVKMCAEAGVALIEDDINAELHFGEERPVSLKAYDREGGVIQCSSFSKSLSPGLRVGWIIPGKYYDQVKALKTGKVQATCTLSEMIAAEFLKMGGYDRHLRRVRTLYQNQLQQIRQAVFEQFPDGTRITAPSGGYLLWAELPTSVDTDKLAVEALQKNISIVPGSLCSATSRYGHAVRINCGHPLDERLEEALRVLGRLASRLL